MEHGNVQSDSVPRLLSRRTLIFITIVAMVSVSALITIVLMAARGVATVRAIHGPPLESIPFDPAIWKRQFLLSSPRLDRAPMLDDLLARYSFTGWNRSEVESLLGTADEVGFDYDFTVDGPEDWDLLYKAGNEFTDSRALIFDLDEQGRVIGYRVALY